MLEKAIELGLAEDSVYYAKGEIEKSMEETDLAAEEFRQCISLTADDALKARAYTMLSRLYEEQGDRGKERDLLLEAREALPVGEQMLILERLIQADIDMAEGADGTAYREEAIGLLKEVISQGWDTYATYDNLVILYDKQGELGLAGEILDQMEEEFGKDYNICKRRAFCEVDLQNEKENSLRDYTMFAQYYDEALRLYEDQLEGNDTDAEMGLLKQVYQQVKTGGWL